MQKLYSQAVSVTQNPHKISASFTLDVCEEKEKKIAEFALYFPENTFGPDSLKGFRLSNIKRKKYFYFH